MSLVLFVKQFDEDRMHSICKVVATDNSHSDRYPIGKEIRIDLTVDAGFDDMPEKELVGKTVSVERLQSCEYIGVGVKLYDENGIKEKNT